MKERWFNYRPICLIACFLLLGSVFSFFITNVLITTLIITTLIFSALLLLAINKKKIKYFLIPLISFIIGISFYFVAIYSFNKTVDYVPTKIQARVYAISDISNGLMVVNADSLKFDNASINDNIIIYIYDYDGLFENIEIGSVVEFKPNKFYNSNLMYYDSPNAKLYAEDLKYTASVKIADIKYISSDKTFVENIKDRVENNLSLGLSNENAEIAYSALFGDKEMLSETQYSVYKLSGVAHLLAVSGLHVGIIVGILSTMLNFKKKKRWWKFALISVILLFYSYICGYAVSIIRACVMSIILMISNLLGKEYDPLTSIALAAIIIFFINPLCIFDVAFLLSFSCVLGITMLTPPIKKLLERSKLPKTIVDSVAISLSTTISIVFVMAYFFNTLNLISIIANVVLIPIFTIAFTVVFLVSIFAYIIPYLGYLLYPINYLFNFISIIATMFGSLSISNINTLQFNFIGIIIYFILLLFMGRFCTAKYQYKIISTLPMVALLFYCLI